MYKTLILIATIMLYSCAKKAPQYNDPIPDHDNFTVHSPQLNEDRVINVWTPPNYKTKTDSLPVLYMLDGGIKEDFPHIANTVAKLVASKQIPPVLLVGIENTERRRDLTGFSEVKADAEYCPLTDGAKVFRAFISETLIPNINSKYPTTAKKGIIGESLAGLFIMETFLLRPQLFDFYIAMDPSLWWNNQYLTRNSKQYLEQFPDTPKTLWFAGSGAEDISKHTNALAKHIANNKPATLQWTYADKPNEKHNTIFRATKEKALVWTLNNLK